MAFKTTKHLCRALRWRLCYKLTPQSILLLFFLSHIASGQIRYSIPEEMKKGSLIGNVALDLGIDMQRLRSGRARILKTDKGILVVNERIDREQLCGDVTPCSFSFDLILENPMELGYYISEIYRWRQSRILYHSNLPVIPYYPPRYSDTLGTGTLQHVYNYEVCRTTDVQKE
uniref:Cadherin N-terminal domain-containing protein n=1 Tax=Lates calcarifer TaxID=8187 RepID=A0A4W6E539_LATCA